MVTLTHERLIDEVATRARLSGTERAVRTVRVCLAALAHRLDMPLRQRLRRSLPGPERDAAYAVVPPGGQTLSETLAEVARNLETSPERAEVLTRTVLSVLAEDDPDLARDVRNGLPYEYAGLFTPAETGSAERSPAGEAPVPLDPGRLETELRRRPRWAGDARRLTRTVGLPGDRTPVLLRQVEKDARELGRHVRHSTGPDGITFTLATSSVGAVTELDLEMADRIDAAVDAVGSGGLPG